MNNVYNNGRAYFSNTRANSAFGMYLNSFLRIITTSGYIAFVLIAYNTDLDASLFALALYSLS